MTSHARNRLFHPDTGGCTEFVCLPPMRLTEPSDMIDVAGTTPLCELFAREDFGKYRCTSEGRIKRSQVHCPS